MRYVEVTWVDAQSHDPWIDKDEVVKDQALAEVISVGMLKSRNKKIITLVLNHDTTNDAYSCIMHIPVGCIKKIRTLK